MLPQAPECIFCGRERTEGAGSEEHIFSRGWLREIWSLPRKHQLPHRAIRGRSDQEGDEIDRWWSKNEANLVAHCVCGTCNSGWMNTLDRRAQLIVNPMVRGEPVVLKTMRQKYILSAWAMKLAFMIDWRQEASTLPPSLARGFLPTLEPPHVARIWLARNVPMTVDGHHVSTTSQSIAEDFYLATFRVDQFVAQILVTKRPVSPRRTRHEGAVREIWPMNFEVVRWPPERTLDSAEYVAFCHAFVNDYLRFGLR